VIGQKLRNWVVGVVTGVWAVNFVASLIPQLKYHSDPTIHAVFMAIVGGVIALGVKKRGDDDDHRGDAP
jgi:hypothetical protein